MEDLGIRVESEPGGGYFILRDLQRLPGILTEDERFVIEIMPLLVQASIADGRVHPLITTYRRAVRKLLPDIVLPFPGNLRESIQTKGGVIAELARSFEESDDRLVLEILYAVRMSRTLEIEYTKIGALRHETRLVDPYYLVPWQNSLYIIGYCHLRQAFRTFKVVRVHGAKCLGKTYVRDPNFSLREFLKSAWGIDESGEEVDVHLRCGIADYSISASIMLC